MNDHYLHEIYRTIDLFREVERYDRTMKGRQDYTLIAEGVDRIQIGCLEYMLRCLYAHLDWNYDGEVQKSCKFDQNQPRVPAGNEDGGRWTDVNGGGVTSPSARPSQSPKLPAPVRTPHIPGKPVSAGTIDNTIKDLEKNAKRGSTGWCARHVREAFAANGVIIKTPDIRPGKDTFQARDYGPKLVEAGFNPVLDDKQPSISPAVEKIKKGDVAVIQPTSQNEAGHMAIYNGQQWISDYR